MRSLSILLYIFLSITKYIVTANPIVNSLSDLPYDENGKLSSYVLVYPQPRCHDLIITAVGDRHGFEVIGLEGDALTAFFPNFDESSSSSSSIDVVEDCPATYLERGVDRSLVTYPLERNIFAKYSENGFDKWMQTATQIELCFVNYVNQNHPIGVYWVSHEGEEIHNIDIPWGYHGMECLYTFVGHAFNFYDSETHELIWSYLAAYTCTIPVGDSPPYAPFNGNPLDYIERQTAGEWVRHGRIKRTFSPVGFKKSRLPNDIFANMGAFYYNNRHHVVREEWYDTAVVVNWYEVDVNFLTMTKDLKHLWHATLQTLVEQWTNVTMETTDMYGLRQYEEGARLLTHVDRHETHAASLILNVAQGNVEESWPIEVYDHAGRLHLVTMEPGDLVYYESAACLHGRNIPLKGKGAYYVNLFAHYRPVGDPNWFEKENPEWTPEPLMDIGECEWGGEEGGVKCENTEIGPYLTEYTISGGDDLMNWWIDVGPPENKEIMAKRKAQKKLKDLLKNQKVGAYKITKDVSSQSQEQSGTEKEDHSEL